MAFDLTIINGTVVDGTGKPRYDADVGIAGGKITAIGDLSEAESAQAIDASGHVVAPGFIDMHTHSDVTLIDDPGGESMAHQGVTTQVTGNCSLTPFPAGKGGPAALQEMIGTSLPSVCEWEWDTLDEWANAMESNGVSLNVAPQVGTGAIRVAAGLTEDRRPTPDELRDMQRLAAEAVEQGAFSLSTGLSIPPSSFADTDEVVALCEAIAPYEGAFYVTHARVWPGHHVKAIEEAIEIGRRGGVPVQFSHIAITDRRHYGSGPEMVAVIEEARAGGFDVTYDVYPYTAAGASVNQIIPIWVQAGDVDDYMARLADPATRQKAKDEMNAGPNGGIPPLWDTWILGGALKEPNRSVIGKSLEEIGELWGVEPAEAALMIVENERAYAPTVVHNRVESDIRFFLSQEPGMIGSDGRAISPHGFYADLMPHPRFYGTYPRILGRYVREDPLMTLETAVFKMAGFPAQRMGFKDRGLVAEGKTADLVVFDPETVIDNATFEEPHQYASGIPHVFVNGVAVISDGVHTGARPGRVLRRGAA